MIPIYLLVSIIVLLLLVIIAEVAIHSSIKEELQAHYNQMNIVLDQNNTIKKRLDGLDLMVAENREIGTDVYSDSKALIDSVNDISLAIAKATDEVRKTTDVAERCEDSLTEMLSLKESIDLFKASCAEQKKASEATNTFFNGLGNLWNYNPYVKKEDENGNE